MLLHTLSRMVIIELDSFMDWTLFKPCWIRFHHHFKDLDFSHFEHSIRSKAASDFDNKQIHLHLRTTEISTKMKLKFCVPPFIAASFFLVHITHGAGVAYPALVAEADGHNQTCTGRRFDREGCGLLKRACPITNNDVVSLVVLTFMLGVLRFLFQG